MQGGCYRRTKGKKAITWCTRTGTPGNFKPFKTALAPVSKTNYLELELSCWSQVHTRVYSSSEAASLPPPASREQRPQLSIDPFAAA